MSELIEEALALRKDPSVESVHIVAVNYHGHYSADDSPESESRVTVYVCYLLCIVYAGVASLITRGNQSYMFDKNSWCLRTRTDGMHVEELWSKIPMLINQCTKRRYLRIHGFSNRDEIKIHVMPSSDAFTYQNTCTIVTLGVGRDVEAEWKMKNVMPKCVFFGADPVRYPNQDMFETIGSFFNIAVGGRNGTSLATVLEPDTANYRIREVNHVDIATFLRNYVRKQFIDQLLVDIEWGEYDVLPYLLKSGELEKSDVVLCQVNIEIHSADYQQKVLFFEFFLELMDDRRFMPLVADRMIGHMRLYLFNHEHAECRRRYIKDH